MFTTYLLITLLTAAANVFSATLCFARHPRILTAMTKAGVPHSWLTPLGLLKAAGALGLLVGILLPPLGLAAAIGLTLFFFAAILTHLRAHDRSVGLPALFLALALLSLATRLLTLP